MDKQQLRKNLKAQRLALSPTMITKQAELFRIQVQKYFGTVTSAKTGIQLKIGIYLAGKGELDLTPSIHWLWQQGHQLYAPIIKGDNLTFSAYTSTTLLKVNQFGLFEPDSESTIDPQHLDCVLVPLLGFDQTGHRLGMGKGYYDRAFAFHTPGQKPILIGCAYAFQEVPELPHEDHDVVLDVIITSSSDIAPYTKP